MIRKPRVVVPVSQGNKIIGTVDIEPNGSFSGKIKIEQFHSHLIEMIKYGKIRSIGISFEIEKEKE